MRRDGAAGRASGGVIGVVGGVISGLAYLMLPAATVPFVGSLRAPDLAGAASEARSVSLLPVVPVTALVAVGVGLWLVLSRPGVRGRRIGAALLIGCALLTALAYLVPYLQLQNELSGSGVSSFGITATTFTGSGFWLALIGAVVMAAGGVVELTGTRVRSSA